MMKKYDFEEYIERNEMNIAVVDAQRFAHALRQAMRDLEYAAGGYSLKRKAYYLDTMHFLKQMEARLSACPSAKEEKE